MASPPPIVNNVRKLYNNCKVKIKIGSKSTEIDYTTGVHQGDNMSPILFLFVIQAFLETLQLKAQPAQFAFFPEKKIAAANRKMEDSSARIQQQKEAHSPSIPPST